MYSQKTVNLYLQKIELINIERKGNFTVTELSKYLETSRVTITRFLQGKMPVRLDLLEQISAMVGVEINILK